VNYNSNPQSIAAGMDNFVTYFHPANTHTTNAIYANKTVNALAFSTFHSN